MQYAIIINAWKWHNSISYACLERNIFPIHISSSMTRFRQTMLGVTTHYYLSFHIFIDIRQLLSELKPFLNNISFVFSCDEHGQYLKDLLDITLKLNNGHSKETAYIRYNKFELFKTLGNPCSDKDYSKFIKSNGPSIIKPAVIEKSGGNIDVSYVDTSSKVQERSDFFISKFLPGDEYQVDLVSSNGKHQFVSVWKMLLTDHIGLWRYGAVHMKYDDDPVFMKNLYQACTSWLDKLDHKFGPVHIDARYNGKEFYCIEINFRLAGCVYYPMLLKNWGKKNQVDLTIDAYTNQDNFPTTDLDVFKTKGYMTCTFLPNYTERNFNDVDWPRIEKFPSVGIIFYMCWKGQPLPICTNNIQSVSAIANLFNEDKNQIKRDWETLLYTFNGDNSIKIEF